LNLCKAHFTLGVSKNVQPKSNIPIVAKAEINPKGWLDAKYSLTSFVQCWFHLSFCILFFSVTQFYKQKAYFLYLLHTQSQQGQNFKTLSINNAVLYKVALSGLKPAPDKARLGCLASRQGRHRKALFNLPQIINKC
jgi:hypothetical protein